MVMFMGAAQAETHDAQSTPTVSTCEVTQVAGPVAQITCTDTLGNVIPGGQVDLPEVIDEVLVPGPTVTLPPVIETVTLPPLPVPTRTVTLPGVPNPTKIIRIPQATQTVREPGQTRTVREEGPVRRVFVPGPTRTVRVFEPVVTVTPAPVTSTVTATATETITRQAQPQRDTLAQDKEDEPFLFDLPPISTPEAVGIGIGAIALIIGMMVLAMMGGYAMGFKDSDRENADFMSALRDKLRARGQHS